MTHQTIVHALWDAVRAFLSRAVAPCHHLKVMQLCMARNSVCLEWDQTVYFSDYICFDDMQAWLAYPGKLPRWTTWTSLHMLVWPVANWSALSPRCLILHNFVQAFVSRCLAHVTWRTKAAATMQRRVSTTARHWMSDALPVMWHLLETKMASAVLYVATKGSLAAWAAGQMQRLHHLVH